MAYTELRFTARDGLRLAGRSYGARGLERVPAVCLAGLTRNSADFDALAEHLANHPSSPRRVVTLDMRGRGASEHDGNPDNYDIMIETADALDGMLAAGIEDASIIGTSRGAILAMAMGAVRPAILHAVVMNDLGPVIEAEGLTEIRDYLEKRSTPSDWNEAVRSLRETQGVSFPALSDSQWDRFARAIYRENEGRLESAHDHTIHATLDSVEPGQAPPPMWTAFDGLRQVPTLSIRGELSTLFSAETQAEMAQRHPGLETHVVPSQGHAPRLDDEDTMERIAAFLAKHDDGQVRETLPPAR